MTLIHPDSLAATVDAVSEAAFLGRPMPKAQREGAARFIAGRQGLPGSYAGMFAPSEKERRAGLRLFTGELGRSRAATGHILGEEACRALLVLDVPLASARKALAQATAGLSERLGDSGKPYAFGLYCCGTCSVSLWRHVLAGGLDRGEMRLAIGLKILKAHRNGAGRYRRFPLHYTMLALAEMDLPAALEEMRYAAPALERSLKRSGADDKFTERRALLAERVLARC